MVTGGSRGIGAGIGKKLAEEGADVGFTDHWRCQPPLSTPW
jgi:NAD(P)-dependent dehydrogenase (short-subunit alcohol dehydrogenase family)